MREGVSILGTAEVRGNLFIYIKKKNRPEMICEYVNTFNSITVQ